MDVYVWHCMLIIPINILKMNVNIGVLSKLLYKCMEPSFVEKSTLVLLPPSLLFIAYNEHGKCRSLSH